LTFDLPFQITIARELGSGGSYLAQRLARRFGFAYLDHEILNQAARELETSDAELAWREERVQGFWARLVQSFATGCPEDIQSPPPVRLISDDELLAAENRALVKLASRGSCVIVGRCAFYRLKGRAPLFNLFVHADRHYRVQRVMQVYHAADPEAAVRMIERTDSNRRRYVQTICNRSWYDARNYHLSIDISRAGFEKAEEAIVAMTGHLMEHEAGLTPVETGGRTGGGGDPCAV